MEDFDTASGFDGFDTSFGLLNPAPPSATIACGSICTELAKGKSIKDALNISQQVILESLVGLPKEYVHCALLASNTLQKAIRNYQKLKRELRE